MLKKFSFQEILALTQQSQSNIIFISSLLLRAVKKDFKSLKGTLKAAEVVPLFIGGL